MQHKYLSSVILSKFYIILLYRTIPYHTIILSNPAYKSSVQKKIQLIKPEYGFQTYDRLFLLPHFGIYIFLFDFFFSVFLIIFLRMCLFKFIFGSYGSTLILIMLKSTESFIIYQRFLSLFQKDSSFIDTFLYPLLVRGTSIIYLSSTLNFNFISEIYWILINL